MEVVKLLRLKTGEDIITYFEQVDKLNFIVREPMVVMVKYDSRTGKQTIMMDHWLPVTLILHNEAFITESEILTILEPTAEFSEYFENAIDTIAKSKKASKKETDSDEEEIKSELMNMMLDSVGPDISPVH
jgi:flagellar hook-basal body complex protein FliE